MSQKITSKNLAYNSSLPPFLAALRAQASNATGPDPLLAAQRRPGKKRSASEEAEDVPLVVDEDGNTIEDLKVDKDGTVQETAEEEADDATKDAIEKDEAKPHKSEAEASKASIGGRKRKAVKVIGDNAEPESFKKDEKHQSTEKDDKGADQATSRKTKKKAKKIKLSFDEEEG